MNSRTRKIANLAKFYKSKMVEPSGKKYDRKATMLTSTPEEIIKFNNEVEEYVVRYNEDNPVPLIELIDPLLQEDTYYSIREEKRHLVEDSPKDDETIWRFKCN